MTGAELALVLVVTAGGLASWAFKASRLASERRVTLATLESHLNRRGCEVVRSERQVEWREPGRLGLQRLRMEDTQDRDNGVRIHTTLALPCGAAPLRLGRHQDEGLFGRFLGEDVELGDPAFDKTWRVRGDPLSARMALTTAARGAVDRLRAASLSLNGQELEATWVEPTTPDGDTQAARLTLALALKEELERGAWPGLAASCGLRLVRPGLLDGVVDGVPVEVRLGTGGTRVRAAVPSPVTAIRRDAPRPLSSPAPTRNPVVDQLLQVEGDVAALPQDEELVGALLAVVHGWPGSRLERDGVLLVSEEALVDGLPSAVEQVLDLARRLRGS